MFFMAMMASAWTVMGRAEAVELWAMGRIFVSCLMLTGRPALPRVFSKRMVNLTSFLEEASDRSLWRNC